MKITLNGKAVETKAETIKALLEEQNLKGKPVVVEYNQTALTASAHEATALQEGDVIECFVLGAGG